jgi:hypothetical protein
MNHEAPQGFSAQRATHIPWTRFWFLRGEVPATDSHGFLVKSATAEDILRTTEQLRDIRCLVLLGEPGIGKTACLRRLQAQEAASGTLPIFERLAAYTSRADLEQALFDEAREREWVHSGKTLIFYLDGLDESLVRPEEVTELFASRLSQYPIDRVKFRITCRTAAWSPALEEVLSSYWQDDLAVVELAPLRREDVRVATGIAKVDVSAFFAQTAAQGVTHLASRPLTLRFLLDGFAGNAAKSQSALFLQASRQLVMRRRDGKPIDDGTAEQRMDVACRIAAVLTFCRRSAVHASRPVPPDHLGLDDIAFGGEGSQSKAGEVSLRLVKSVLASCLFEEVDGSLDLIHKGLRDFLAAYYLVRHRVAMTAALDVFTGARIGDEHVYPELADTAVWYAGMNRDFFDHLVAVDPQVLLRHEVATADDSQKHAIVEALLKLFDREKLTDSDWDLLSSYGRLNHPGIADQLRPYIIDRSKGPIVRRVAIDIAEECSHAKSLEDVLAAVALDDRDAHHTRVQAAYALTKIADVDTRIRLKALLSLDERQDPDDQLKGCALRALWPDHITAQEVFAALRTPRQRSFFGAYQRFLLSDLVPALRVEDLPTALQWVREQETMHRAPFVTQNLIHSIIHRAVDYLSHPEIEKLFAAVVWPRLNAYEDVLSARGSRLRDDRELDETQRRRVVETLVKSAPKESEERLIVFRIASVARRDDLQWVLDKVPGSDAEQAASLWAHLARALFEPDRFEHVETVLATAAISPRVANAFEDYLEPIDLTSEAAKRLRAKWREMAEHRTPRKQELLDPPPQVRIVTFLERFEHGDVEAWWQLAMEMTLEATSTHYGDEYEPDITALPGWQLIEQDVRSRIIHAASNYLVLAEPTPEKWLGQNVFFRPAAAAYKALRLLQRVQPSTLDALPVALWERWACAIVGYPLSGGEDDVEDAKLLHRCYEKAPRAVITSLTTVIDAENASGSTLFILRRVATLWDDQLSHALEQKLPDSKLNAGCMADLLKFLLDRGSTSAFQIGVRTLRENLDLQGEEPERRAEDVAVALIRSGSVTAWRAVWPLIVTRTTFAAAVVSRVAHSQEERHVANFAAELSEDELATFFIWLLEHFPPQTDPKHPSGEVHAVTPRDSVADFRNAILRRLQERGTVSGVKALERIATTYPDEKWLRWTLVEARKVMLAKQWRPPSPQELLGLVGAAT